MKRILFAILIQSLSGCASMFQGSEQIVNIQTSGYEGNAQLIECTIKNEEGEWFSTGKASINIERDGNPMDVSCKNETHQGQYLAEPKFEAHWLLADILWDACVLTLSCIIDGANNAFYEYNENIVVPMKPIESQ